jgi:hypothetical protein
MQMHRWTKAHFGKCEGVTDKNENSTTSTSGGWNTNKTAGWMRLDLTSEFADASVHAL